MFCGWLLGVLMGLLFMVSVFRCGCMMVGVMVMRVRVVVFFSWLFLVFDLFWGWYEYGCFVVDYECLVDLCLG